MIQRRQFIKLTAAGAGLLALKQGKPVLAAMPPVSKPVVLSTWDHGLAANEAAWKVLADGGRALDAVEAGVRVPEADPKVTSVGYGGLPDRDGKVTLDACIMDEQGNCGSVMYLQHIMHPVSVARQVMEKTPHIMLAGEGALRFALQNGFKKENLLTDESAAAWKRWLSESKYQPQAMPEDHDTIGMIAMDQQGNLSGACTTSGLGYKYHGRVGDSPIIGAGLFVDNEVGAATATGNGEEVVRIAGASLIVELMRNGFGPQQACETAVDRILKNYRKRNKEIGKAYVCFIALNKNGEHGAYAFNKKFQFACMTAENGNKLIDSEYRVIN